MDAIAYYSDSDSDSDSNSSSDVNDNVKDRRDQGEIDVTMSAQPHQLPPQKDNKEETEERRNENRAIYYIPEAPPQEQVDPELREKINTLFEMREKTGRSINSELNESTAFSNPSLLDKLARLYQIDQTGSQCDPKDFDPHGALSTDFTTIPFDL